MFKTGKTAGEFYRGRDTELENMKNYVFDADGKAHEDTVSPNHKLTKNFFYLFTTQLVAYLLGNGVSFENPEIKEKLGGSEFDYKLQRLLAYAACDGESYGYVDETGITQMCYACKLEGKEPYCIPLYDENDGELKAAIRYWRLTENSPLRVTLYEIDGFTEYKEAVDDKNNPTGVIEVMQEKSSYKGTEISNAIEGSYRREGKNPGKLPVVPMGFICGQSSIVGNIALIHAYNVILSDMANGVDMNTTFWKVKNADGMDKRDDNNLLYDIFRTHVIHTPEGVEVDKEEVSMRTAEYQNVLAMIEAILYDNFQAVRTANISATAKTTVEIKAAYENLNMRCDEVEKYVADFIRGCLEVIGEDPNEPFHFKRPNNINQSEFVQLILSAVPVIGDDVALKQILECLGMIDEYEAIKEQREAEDLARMQLIASQSAQNNAQGGSEGIEV